MKTLSTATCLTAALLLAACSDEPGNEQIGAAPTTEGRTPSTMPASEAPVATPESVTRVPVDIAEIPSPTVEVPDTTETPLPPANN